MKTFILAATMVLLPVTAMAQGNGYIQRLQAETEKLRLEVEVETLKQKLEQTRRQREDADWAMVPPGQSLQSYYPERYGTSVADRPDSQAR